MAFNTLKSMAAKVSYMSGEAAFLIRRHRLYFLAPVLIMLILLAFLVYYIGPTVVMSFIYAGV